MEYAFRVFAAIYGYRVAGDSETGPSRTFIYGGLPAIPGQNPTYTRIPARYSPERTMQSVQNLAKVRHAQEDVFLFHGVDPVTRQPDWLGEIFDWLSGSWEKSIVARDSVGRIPDASMIFARLGLPTVKPQAALHMAWLEQFSRGRMSDESLPAAPSPVRDAKHLVICSHDVDFYYTSRSDAAVRLLKNLAIAALLYKDASYFTANCSMLLQLITGARPGNDLSRLMCRLQEQNCRSTFFVVPARGHRRDPNYALSDLPLRLAATRSFPVELHASYTSILEKHTLQPEVRRLAEATGKRPLANRQHWLRFSDQQALFQAVEQAGLAIDSSLGFSDAVGFRNGACFAFPPYNFNEERAHEFLEVPLAIMDGSLIEGSRASGDPPQVLADHVLEESRKRGWGGISILWHNPLETLSVPDAINQVFWDSLAKRQHFHEKWVSTDEFLALSLTRYQDAGLLTKIRLEDYSPSERRSAGDNSLAATRAFNTAQSLT
jgi:hypothetical protein